MSETIIIRDRKRTGTCEDCQRTFECSVMATRKVCCARCARRRARDRRREYSRVYRSVTTVDSAGRESRQSNEVGR